MKKKGINGRRIGHALRHVGLLELIIEKCREGINHRRRSSTSNKL